MTHTVFRAYGTGVAKQSRFYAQLAEAVCNHADVLDELAVSGSRATPAALFSALHYLTLTGVQHPLAACFRSASQTNPDSTVLAASFKSFMKTHAAQIAEILRVRRFQANELNRCSVLAPAMRVAQVVSGSALGLLDIGAGSGLNLLFDSYVVHYSSEWCGASLGDIDSSVRIDCELKDETILPRLPAPTVSVRVGLDLNRTYLDDADDLRWLYACLPPDRPDQARQFAAAIEVARARHSGVVEATSGALPVMIRNLPTEVTPVVVGTRAPEQSSNSRDLDLIGPLEEAGRHRRVLWLSAERLRSTRGTGLSWNLVEFIGHSMNSTTLADSDDLGTWLKWMYQPGSW
ncbi:DUF2332 domain-containing protein [Nocardia sp. CDC160]|uniref:DUF2332 domain-containing protein n=1 Tax=Nocardia sp. CDC160 TaxID=3112166 RepID=UPI002DB5EDE9|nr:DUF2332 domain-containing protein [Nocardia sp. CDC160]MEC3919174.1 DUF2332 domain-containing protein [Nocardia sp. CDC160]